MRAIIADEWFALDRSLELSMQQVDIVRSLMTLPALDKNGNQNGGVGNSNSRITLGLTAERKARLERMGRTLRPAEEDGRRSPTGKGQGPIPVETVAKQQKRVFKKLGVHSRMERAMRVDVEIAVMWGWIKPTRDHGFLRAELRYS